MKTDNQLFPARLKSVLALACMTFLALSFSSPAHSQERPYFVDGYHGGVYGHYPMKTYTQFLVDQFNDNPDWRFCLEIEPETWDTVAVRTPAAYELFSGIVKSPRVEFTNPAYAQPYMYNISGESIIRQMQYGMKKIHSHFPEVEFVTYSVEEPCFTSCLPGILDQLGYRYASLKCPNTCWGGYTAAFGHGLVNWTGPDGTSILAVPRYECEELDSTAVWRTTASSNSDRYLQACRRAGIIHPVGMCFQDAGWTNGPWIGKPGEATNNSQYVTWREYFETVASGDPREDYKMSQEDVRTSLMWGSQVLQLIAQQVRRSENKIVMTEKIGAMLGLIDGKKIDQSLIDESWRTLMLSQHHDSWIVPYNNLNKYGTWADNITLWTGSADSNCDKVLDALTSEGDGGTGSYSISVFNTAGFGRSALVSAEIPAALEGKALSLKTAKGRNVPFAIERNKILFRVEALPFGVTAFKLGKAGRSRAIEPEVTEYAPGSDAVTVSGGGYTIVLDPAKGGVITSLTGSDGYEYCDPYGSRHLNEIRGYFYDQAKWHSSSDAPASVEVRRIEGFKTTVIVKGSIARNPFVQTLTLEEGSPMIRCSLHIDWKEDEAIGKYRQDDAGGSPYRAFYEDRYKLNILFPTTLSNPQLFKDAPFDVCQSRLENTWFDNWFDIKHCVLLNWVDLFDKESDRSFALYSDHTTTYSYGQDFPLSLTILYSGDGLWARNHPVTRPTDVEYAIMPHSGRWDSAGLQERNCEWNEPLVSRVSGHDSLKSESLIDLEGTGYVVSAFYQTEGGYVLRVYNADGDESRQRIRLHFPVGEVSEVDLRGNAISTVAAADGRETVIPVSAPRFSVRTYMLKTEYEK